MTTTNSTIGKTRLPGILALVMVVAYPFYGMFLQRFVVPLLPVHGGIATDLAHEAMVWLYALLALVVATRWGSLSLAEIGLRRPTWKTPLIGIAGAVVGLVLSIIAALIVYEITGQKSHADTVAAALTHGSLLYAALVAVRAGAVEELLYRGIAIEQLAAFIDSRWLAALLAGVVFILAHALIFDRLQLIPIAVATLVMTLLYMWRRDLWANMLAHILFDAFGLIMVTLRGHG